MNLHRTQRIAAALILLAAAAPARAQTAATPAASPATPIPDIATLMHQVLENQNQLDKIRENYACRDAREVKDLDKHGRIKKTTMTVYEISFLGSHEIQRLVEKDGQPLSPKEQQKEDDRIRKQVEKYEREQQKDENKQAEQTRKAELSIQNFLEADRFVNPRRERLEGREVIVFDFEANPAFHAKSRVEKLAQSLVGTIWIDAQAHEVVRLEARFAKSFKIGWGLVASVHPGTAVAFKQTLVNNQVWLPTYVQAHVNARALFFGVNQNEIDRYTDYRRFHVKSSSATFPPKQPKQ
jgi:hypothetical protein